MSFPYSYISCPCADTSTPIQALGAAAPSQQENDENEEKTFDPRSPRANFSLFPADYLMWCEDCHDIKCERCTVEEILFWYCPNCLFETPSSMVKSDGNR
jgi:dynactin-4